MERVESLELAKRLIRTRKAAGLTQVNLARKAGKSPATISGLESGKVARPHLGTILDLADALGVEPSELTGGAATLPKASLPPDFDAVEIFREVLEEVGLDNSKELMERADERFARELGDRFSHLSREEQREALEAIHAGLQSRAAGIDKSFHSPIWSDPEKWAEEDRLKEERRAVRLALLALDRVLTEA